MHTSSTFLGSKIRKTGENLSTQVAKILKEFISEIEPRTIPVLATLNENNSASISELGDKLGFTHPAIIQLVNKLEGDKLITVTKSESDRRLTILQLTPKGKDIINKLEPVLSDIDEIISSMISDIDVNLLYSLLRLEKAVKEEQLVKKVSENAKRKALSKVEIVSYKKKYKTDFKNLNEEWLKKYFVVEDEDKRQLLNPEKEIINKGGEIFFALLNKEVLGTCAMIKIDDSVFELVKMAVTEKAQGKQIGKKLMLTCIGFAVEKEAKKIVLSTNPKLTTATNLYRSVGFKKVNAAENSVYKRALFLMELDLTSD